MAKPQDRPSRPAPAARSGIGAQGRRLARPDEAPAQASPPAGPVSLAGRLAAEVETLRAELAAARARVAELEVTADVDPLLDVLNRRGFERELKRSLAHVQRYGTPAALVYLDLDGFKPVNDRHGHAAGDAVLEAVAAALLRQVRGSDVVARLGGDEFAVLLWHIGEANAAAKAETLEAAVGSACVAWDGGMLAVGASAGFAMLGPRDDAAAVLARADRAMYARKAARRG
jgi:diguanylate cyclase (GGDEF)-like protein